MSEGRYILDLMCCSSIPADVVVFVVPTQLEAKEIPTNLQHTKKIRNNIHLV